MGKGKAKPLTPKEIEKRLNANTNGLGLVQVKPPYYNGANTSSARSSLLFLLASRVVPVGYDLEGCTCRLLYPNAIIEK